MPSANPTPHPLDAAARDELAPRGLDLDSETSEVPRFWRCMCCRFATAVEREIHVHLDETGHGFVSDNHYAALLASVRGAEAETARTPESSNFADLRDLAAEARVALAKVAPPSSPEQDRDGLYYPLLFLTTKVEETLRHVLRDAFESVREENEGARRFLDAARAHPPTKEPADA